MPRSDNALFKRGAGCKKGGSSVLFALRKPQTGRRVRLPSAVFFPLGKFVHPLVSPVMPFFAILELFLLLFIPCIQESRKLFDCNEHILRAQYHGEELFPASFRKPI